MAKQSATLHAIRVAVSIPPTSGCIEVPADNVESFNGKLRDELLEREIFDTLWEAKVLIERWKREYNTFRPHSSLGYQPPAPEAVQAWSFRYAALREKTKLDSAKP